MTIEPIALAGYREAIGRDAAGGVERHFVILPFAARWIAGEARLNEELSDAHWLDLAELGGARNHRRPRRDRRRRHQARGAARVNGRGAMVPAASSAGPSLACNSPSCVLRPMLDLARLRPAYQP